MKENKTIQKDITLPPEQDYHLLRKEGLRYIENLASNLWTDYNAHDPGVTILEALCYALSELGYRTDFDIKDILADENGAIGVNQCFYTAREILTTHPQTITDYRKLLIDQENIQNAWLYPAPKEEQEVTFYADYEQNKLSTENPQPGSERHRINLSGLYHVILNLNNHPKLGDLNNTHIRWRIPGSDVENKVFTFLFTDLETLASHHYSAVMDVLCSDQPTDHISSLAIQRKSYCWEVELEIKYSIDHTDYVSTFKLLIRMDSVQKRNAILDMETQLTDWFAQDHFIRQIFTLYKNKTERIDDILTTVKALLWEHRNLCEDFLKIQTVTNEEIALCADIEVAPEADIEEILGTIYYKVQEYFSPSLKFHSLKSLLDAGKPADEIFESPMLSHGFIEEEELKKTQLRRVIHNSDLVNLIMEIEGVLAVKDLLLTQYNEKGEPQLSNKAWSLDIGNRKKPLLNVDRSKIIFYKGKIPLKAKISETFDTLKYLQAINSRDKLYGMQDDLLLPKGTHYDLSDYYSIQNDLPQTYGVGQHGLPGNAGPQRIAQSRQLKAYLMFYDQLLANFFAQLKGVKNLFSLDRSIEQSYFTQYLVEANPPFYEEGVKGIKDIYREPVQLKELLKGQAIDSSDWQALVENKETFFKRRNSFLDHLLARFAESFNDYALMMYNIHFDLQQSYTYSEEKVIKDKIAFLEHYPEHSRNRGKGYNYCPIKKNSDTAKLELDQAALWHKDNVSGLEQRTARFAGIPSWPEDRISTFLFCMRMADIIKDERMVKDENGIEKRQTNYSFAFYNEQNKVLFRSVKTDFSTRTNASDAASYAARFMADSSYYYARKQPDDSWKLFICDSKDDKTNLLVTDNILYASLPEANQAKQQYVQLFDTECNQEGLYLIEHLLLRPRSMPAPHAPFELMDVNLDKECHSCGGKDPYSFRISVVLPYWPNRFRNVYFKRYVEGLLQEEAPAHIALKVCWVNNKSMRAFEISYRSWGNALAAYKAHPKDEIILAQYRDANDQLIQILQHLNSEYPLATLHNCEESEGDNLVILGNTALGTYKM